MENLLMLSIPIIITIILSILLQLSVIDLLIIVAIMGLASLLPLVLGSKLSNILFQNVNESFLGFMNCFLWFEFILIYIIAKILAIPIPRSSNSMGWTSGKSVSQYPTVNLFFICSLVLFISSLVTTLILIIKLRRNKNNLDLYSIFR